MSADPEVTREMEPVGNLLDNLPDSARLPTADDEPKWDVARWMAEGLGYPFDIETTIPLHPYMREYVEEAWVVLEGEHGDDLEAAIRRNVAQAGGWAS